MQIGIIVAYDRNKAIGKDGKIPWKIKGEQKQFKELTTENIIVMGRKTYEEIGRPLPNRINVVISSSLLSDISTEERYQHNKDSELYIYKSLDDFIEDYKIANKLFGFLDKGYIEDFHKKNLYGTGGRRIFEYFLKIADVIYATEIDHEYKGDVFFPYIDDKFKDSGRRYEVVETVDQDNINITYTRKMYLRRR